jgi:hypothetical protein
MFIAHLLGRTIRVEEGLIDQLFNSGEKRLALMLLLLVNLATGPEVGLSLFFFAKITFQLSL